MNDTTTPVKADLPAIEADARQFLETYWPADLDDHEMQYVASHQYGRTFVQLTVYGTRDSRGEPLRRPSYYRFGARLVKTVATLEDQPDHDLGVCTGCTQRWRIDNGLGADVRDLQELPT